MVKFLLHMGANKNAANGKGWTPLMRANNKMISVILKHGLTNEDREELDSDIIKKKRKVSPSYAEELAKKYHDAGYYYYYITSIYFLIRIARLHRHYYRRLVRCRYLTFTSF